MTWRDDPTLDEADRKVLADIEEHGWHALHVHDEGRLPYWTFSIGIHHTWGRPEVVVFGLQDRVAHEVLWEVVRRIERGETFSPGHEYSEILERYSVRFVEVDPKWYDNFLGYAIWFYGPAPSFPTIQLVWPDSEGRYPWEEGYAMSDGVQPLLVSDHVAAELGVEPPPLDLPDPAPD